MSTGPDHTAAAPSCEASLRAMARRLIPERDANFYRILDIGCGVGDLLPILEARIDGSPFRYRGLAASEDEVEQAKGYHVRPDGNVDFALLNDVRLAAGTELEWYNVIVARDCIERDEDIAPVCEHISKTLIGDGVFHIRASLGSSSVVDRESFLRLVASRFESEALYDLEVFDSADASGRMFLNLFGRKSSLRHFSRYHYGFGYDPALRDLGKTLARYVNDVVHFGDDTVTFRHEGYLMAMSEADFRPIMNVLERAVARFRPGRFPIYLKDKLNIQHYQARFMPHQDATACWNERIGPFEFVTFGMPLEPVVDSSYGGTRIAIRQDYRPETLDHSRRWSSRSDGEPSIEGHQFLNCLAVPGTYYAYDQYVIHDSSPNTRDCPRSVLFITCILDDRDERHSRAIARRYAHLLETRPGIDVVRHTGTGHPDDVEDL